MPKKLLTDDTQNKNPLNQSDKNLLKNWHNPFKHLKQKLAGPVPPSLSQIMLNRTCRKYFRARNYSRDLDISTLEHVIKFENPRLLLILNN